MPIVLEKLQYDGYDIHDIPLAELITEVANLGSIGLITKGATM
jgi:hypothetical protein